MSLRLYNTLTRTKEVFVPLDPKNVRMYVCGPTVYDYAHIGNARPAIVFDVLFRLLRHTYGEQHVTYVRNVTDIDDKINARALARRGDRNVPILDVVRELTEETYGVYRADVAALGNLPPTLMPRATENVPHMIAMIEALVAKGHAYPAQGHVLFDVSSKPDYGKLSRRTLDDMIAGARVEVAPYKKNPMDFVLWKPSDANTPGWDSPWGRGRPGWHIECSSMIETGFPGTDTIDIHGGGIDLVFPHHENEIAQSEGVHHDHPLAKIWMHNGFLNAEGEKMSKSLGNFVTINELLNEYPGGALRLVMLETNYRQPINWTQSRVERAWLQLRSWVSYMYGTLGPSGLEEIRVRRQQGQHPQPHESVIEALTDDLNTPNVLTALHGLYAIATPESMLSLLESCEFLGVLNASTMGGYVGSPANVSPTLLKQAFETIELLKVAFINSDAERVNLLGRQLEDLGLSASVLGGGLFKVEQMPSDAQDRISLAIDARNAARKAKDFKESDRIRDELLAQGIALKDNPDGTTSWEVKR
jgi:cysteinyl-tRNA synthetase